MTPRRTSTPPAVHRDGGLVVALVPRSSSTATRSGKQWHLSWFTHHNGRPRCPRSCNVSFGDDGASVKLVSCSVTWLHGRDPLAVGFEDSYRRRVDPYKLSILPYGKMGYGNGYARPFPLQHRRHGTTHRAGLSRSCWSMVLILPCLVDHCDQRSALGYRGALFLIEERMKIRVFAAVIAPPSWGLAPVRRQLGRGNRKIANVYRFKWVWSA
jgi:hypothetical protein